MPASTSFNGWHEKPDLEGLRCGKAYAMMPALFGNKGGFNENVHDRISDHDRIPGDLLCVQHAARVVNTRVWGRKP